MHLLMARFSSWALTSWAVELRPAEQLAGWVDLTAPLMSADRKRYFRLYLIVVSNNGSEFRVYNLWSVVSLLGFTCCLHQPVIYLEVGFCAGTLS